MKSIFGQVSIKRTHVIGLKSTKGEYDHISKGCRVACVYSGLIWTLTSSYSFFSDCCCWIVFNNLIQFYELDYLYQRASSRACSPILSCKGVTIQCTPLMAVWMKHGGLKENTTFCLKNTAFAYPRTVRTSYIYILSILCQRSLSERPLLSSPSAVHRKWNRHARPRVNHCICRYGHSAPGNIHGGWCTLTLPCHD